MASPVKIIGRNNEEAEVLEGAQVVTNLPPPVGIEGVKTRPYIESLLNPNDETSNLGGANGVSGTLLNPVDLAFSAESDDDIYLKELSILISGQKGGSGFILNEFGGLPALVNGFVPFYEEDGVKSVFTQRPLKTNLDFLRIGTLSPQVGADESAYRLKGAKTAADYAYLAVWDLTQLGQTEFGIRIRQNSSQKVGFSIRDDLSVDPTALSFFEVVAFGFRRF